MKKSILDQVKSELIAAAIAAFAVAGPGFDDGLPPVRVGVFPPRLPTGTPARDIYFAVRRGIYV